MTKKRGGLVWSSDPGAVQKPPSREQVERPKSSSATAPPDKQTARLGRSRKGRGGKTVTTVEGLILDPAGYQELARVLRQRCGVGGTVRDDVIEVQGDIRERVAQVLQEVGYRVKLVGG